MGREIRKVPPNWEHPRYTADNVPKILGHYMPMYDKDYETAVREWKEGFIAWENGTHEDLKDHPERKKEMEFWDWATNPPDKESYRPKFSAEPTWLQVYETVSEGTPVSPPFATKEELARYLSENGDFSYQAGYRDISPKQTYEKAIEFIERGWVPSGIFEPGKGFLATYDTI